jgi:hypothetical protein
MSWPAMRRCESTKGKASNDDAKQSTRESRAATAMRALVVLAVGLVQSWVGSRGADAMKGDDFSAWGAEMAVLKRYATSRSPGA